MRAAQSAAATGRFIEGSTSSCPGSSRASTSSRRQFGNKDVDGRVKPGHDEKVQSHAIVRGFTIREQCRKPPFAVAGEIDDAAARRAIARGPFQFGEARHHGGAQRAGEVMAPFAPVETGLAYRAARMRQHVGRYLPGLLQKSFALRGQ